MAYKKEGWGKPRLSKQVFAKPSRFIMESLGKRKPTRRAASLLLTDPKRGDEVGVPFGVVPG